MVSIIVSFVVLFVMSLGMSYLIGYEAGWKKGFNDAYDMYEKEGDGGGNDIMSQMRQSKRVWH